MAGSEWFDRSEPEPDETDDEHYTQRPTSAGSYKDLPRTGPAEVQGIGL